jgi:colanic acid biosynthesis glycosyl transferase WcaI
LTKICAFEVSLSRYNSQSASDATLVRLKEVLASLLFVTRPQYRASNPHNVTINDVHRSMTRVIFVNRLFFPDQSATSRMVSTLAFALADGGKEVHVITSRQLYNDPNALLPVDEITRGVHIHRVASSQFGRSKLPGRTFDYVSFCYSSWRAIRAIASRGDILVAMTDPPLFSFVAMRAGARRGAHLVNWLQDIYPEIAVLVGVPFVRTALVRNVLSRLRDHSLKVAKANVVVGQRVADKFVARGVSDRLHVIHNWSDDHEILPLANVDNPLRKAWGLAEKFVVGYSGNLGRAHDYETLLAAAERLRYNSRIVFLFIGAGHLMAALARQVSQRGLDQTFLFMPFQEQSALKYSLCVPDVHWLSLPPEFEGLIVPSKFYGIAAAGRPIIAISAKDGELARTIKQHQCGVVVEPGDVDALEQAIILLSTDVERRAAMGTSARAMLDAHYTAKQAFGRWRGVIDNVEAANADAI